MSKRTHTCIERWWQGVGVGEVKLTTKCWMLFTLSGIFWNLRGMSGNFIFVAWCEPWLSYSCYTVMDWQQGAPGSLASETRRNRSCRVTTPHGDTHSRSRSRHRNVRPAPPRDKSNDRWDRDQDVSVLDGKENNFVVPCTPSTLRGGQKQRPLTTLGSSPTHHYPRTPSSPPACLTTTLPTSS